ncbi:MAG TPA: DUF1488 domain-containing protein [Burkholderiaceae bacterium]|nr:DUF1488 domain-containing protein [Burkholderiaceae bacterium]
MEIEFPNRVLPKVTAMGTVSFQAQVDGKIIWCEISIEALRDHFGATPGNGDAMVRAFHNGRTQIEEVARRYIEANDGLPVLLMSANF